MPRSGRTLACSRMMDCPMLLACMFATCVLVQSVGASASPPREMTLIEQYPKARQVMSGTGVAFTLTFDGPVDHARSGFLLVTPHGMVRVFLLRLNTQPNTLYASVGRLEPGDYVLNWHAHAMNGLLLNGSIPFSVGKP
jgi:methionine-rich copper-binding protein CopC